MLRTDFDPCPPLDCDPFTHTHPFRGLLLLFNEFLFKLRISFPFFPLQAFCRSFEGLSLFRFLLDFSLAKKALPFLFCDVPPQTLKRSTPLGGGHDVVSVLPPAPNDPSRGVVIPAQMLRSLLSTRYHRMKRSAFSHFLTMSTFPSIPPLIFPIYACHPQTTAPHAEFFTLFQWSDPGSPLPPLLFGVA